MIVYPNVKINLGLSVIRKRDDGYHDLETLFVPYFGFRDKLEIVRSEQASIELISGDWDPHKDLTWKAWELMRQEYGIGPVAITLEKHSPVGAGLGGGSADAAFALIALNDLFGLGLGPGPLASLAARLGSDCPFFIYNRPSFATGRGEQLEDFPLDLSGYEIKVALPQGVSVSTKEAYSNVIPRESRSHISIVELPERLNTSSDKPSRQSLALASSDKPSCQVLDNEHTIKPSRHHSCEIPLREVLKRPVEEWKDLLINDFERSVFPLHPEIADLKQSFYEQGAVYASMSGSGSAVFALFTPHSLKHRNGNRI